MSKHLLSLFVALGMMVATVQPVWAFVQDQPPTFANGGVDPNTTGDPVAVTAAQRALEAFFGYTNREYSNRGYANAWLMRQEIGNRQSDWLDQTLPLACGRLVSGWKNRNRIPGRGWRHEAPPSVGIARGSLLYNDPGGETVVAWVADRTSAPALPPELAQLARRPASRVEDREATRIMESLEIELGGQSDD